MQLVFALIVFGNSRHLLADTGGKLGGASFGVGPALRAKLGSGALLRPAVDLVSGQIVFQPHDHNARLVSDILLADCLDPKAF